MMMKSKQGRARKQYVQTVNPTSCFGNVRHRIWDGCKLETFDTCFFPKLIHMLPLKAGVETLA